MSRNIFFILFITFTQLYAQNPAASFFPDFAPYSSEPIFEFGDGIVDSPWNDPCVLKENDTYIMYVSGAESGILHPDDSVTIYRFTSPDGYDWTLNPTNKLIKPLPDTYYEGAIETPTVVFYKGEYHMYSTVYSINESTNFKLGHATSPDGINWTMDPSPFLIPTTENSWMSEVVGDPGVVVRNDTLLVFYTAVAWNGAHSIGIVKSINGNTIVDTVQALSFPQDVYPPAQNYVGLSTPAPIMIGDTLYLYTDVVQYVLDNWTQVGLHQFKTYGSLTNWLHDSEPIHTQQDFTWTNGNYLSELRSVHPLMDGNRLRIWYAGNHLSDINTTTDDTTYYVHFVGDAMYANPGKWGFGTSEYVFEGLVTTQQNYTTEEPLLFYNDTQHTLSSKHYLKGELKIYSTNGILINQGTFSGSHSVHQLPHGIYLVTLTTHSGVIRQKIYIKQ